MHNGKEQLDGVDIPEAKDLEAVLGKGIKASLGNNKVYIGNLDLFESLDDDEPEGNRRKSKIIEILRGNTTMLIRQNDNYYIGIIALMDATPRQEAKNTLKNNSKNWVSSE